MYGSQFGIGVSVSLLSMSTSAFHFASKFWLKSLCDGQNVLLDEFFCEWTGLVTEYNTVFLWL